MYKSKRKTLKNKLEFNGYYFDGKKLFLMYMDKYGNIVTKEDKDERQVVQNASKEIRG